MMHLGLEIVWPPPRSPLDFQHRVDIVCIHGLGGGVTSTWHDDATGKTWISDPDFLGRLGRTARIMTYGYNADVAANMSSSAIALHAAELLGLLSTAYARWGGSGIPLLLVAHGFGGLVAKKALMLGQAFSNYATIWEAVESVLFLGTTHHTSDTDALLKAVRHTTVLFARKGSVIAEDDMREYAEAAREINVDFARAGAKDIDLISFFEEQPSKLCPAGEEPYEAVIVTPASDELNDRQFAKTLMMDCTHKDLAKFPASTDTRFRTVLSELLQLVDDAIIREVIPLSEAPALVIGLDPIIPGPAPGPLPEPRPVPSPVGPKGPVPVKQESDDGKKEAKDKRGGPRYQDEVDMRFKVWSQRKNSEDTKIRRDDFLASLRGWGEGNFGNDIFPIPGTCQWIHTQGIFKRWSVSPFSESLFVSGEAGCGKTYLAKSVAAHLKAIRPHDIVLAFFCNVERTGQTRPRILDYVLSELLRLRPKMFDLVPLKYQHRTADSPPLSPGSLADIFNNFKRFSTPTNIYLVIDGLNQCDLDHIQAFLRCLDSVVDPIERAPLPPTLEIKRPRTKFKPFLTVVPNEAIIIGTGDASRFGIPPEEAKRDLSTYVDAMIAKFTPVKVWKTSPGEVAASIKERAGIFFPHAKYSFEVLEAATGKTEELYQNSHPFPDGLRRYYDYDILPILQGVDNHQYSRAALLILVAAMRPLKINELTDAMAVAFDNPDVRSLDLMAVLSRTCSHTVALLADNSLAVVHESVVRHFNAYMTPAELHANMTHLCVKYLLRDEFENPLPLYQQPPNEASEYVANLFPFFSYACGFWRAHLIRCQHLTETLKPQLLDFLRDDGPHYRTWYHAHCFSMNQKEAVALRTNPAIITLIPPNAGRAIHLLTPEALHDAEDRQKPASWADDLRLRAAALVLRVFPSADRELKAWIRSLADFDGQNPLMIAALVGQLDLVRWFLTWPHIDIDGRSRLDGATALTLAIQFATRDKSGTRRAQDMVLEILRAGANPNVSKYEGTTALHQACLAGNLELARMLLEFGADVNVADIRGQPPLLAAYESKSMHIMELLVIGHRADVDIVDLRGRPLLCMAIRDNRLDEFYLFAKFAKNINMRDADGLSALHHITIPDRVDWMPILLRRPDLDLNMISEVSSRSGRPSKRNALKYALGDENFRGLRLLLEAGAVPGLLPQETCGELFRAVTLELYDAVELLLEYGAPVNAVHWDRYFTERTPLSSACFKKNAALVRLLLRHGADPTVEEGYGFPGPLHSAVFAQSPEIVSALLGCALKPDVNYTPKGDDHVLLLAARKENVEVLKLLLAESPDMDAFLAGRPKTSPLHEAARCGRVENCEALLAHEPRLLDLQHEEGIMCETPLQTAARYGEKAIVRLLLDKGARTDLTTCHYDESLLVSACMGGNLDVVKMVHEADSGLLDLAGYDGGTALMMACSEGDTAAVEYLTKQGARVDMRDDAGRTCLACVLSASGAGRRLRMLRALCEHGGLRADDVVNARGLTAVGEAARYGDALALRYLLRERGGDAARAQHGPGDSIAWRSALQVACESGQRRVVELLLEPEWGCDKWIANTDWEGNNVLHRVHPRGEQLALLERVFWACRRVEEDTGWDCLGEMLRAENVRGLRPLDMAAFAVPRPLSAEGEVRIRNRISQMVLRLLPVHRTLDQHAHMMESLSADLVLLGSMNLRLEEVPREVVLAEGSEVWEDSEAGDSEAEAEADKKKTDSKDTERSAWNDESGGQAPDWAKGDEKTGDEPNGEEKTRDELNDAEKFQGPKKTAEETRGGTESGEMGRDDTNREQQGLDEETKGGAKARNARAGMNLSSTADDDAESIASDSTVQHQRRRRQPRGEFDEDALRLARCVLISNDMDEDLDALDGAGALELTGVYIYNCAECSENISRTAYICRHCNVAICGDCHRRGWDARRLYRHEWLELRLEPRAENRDLNHREVQAILRKLKERFAPPVPPVPPASRLSPVEEEGTAKEAVEDEAARSEDASGDGPPDFSPDSEATTLSLATLHAFGYLRTPRPIFGMYLPLAPAVERRLAAFEGLDGWRAHLNVQEERAWAAERGRRRAAAELGHLVRNGRRRAYVDVELVLAEQALDGLEGLWRERPKPPLAKAPGQGVGMLRPGPGARDTAPGVRGAGPPELVVVPKGTLDDDDDDESVVTMV